jgi:hypothetical protein
MVRFAMAAQLRDIRQRLIGTLLIAVLSALTLAKPSVCSSASSPSLAAALTQDGLAPVLSLALRGPFATKADWHVIAYQAPGEEGRFGAEPARICFRRRADEAGQDCTSLTHAATNDSERLAFQTVTGLSVTTLLQGPTPVSAVMAQAEMSYGGSGTATQYALWTYRAATDRFQPLATFQITEQGELQVIADGKLAGSVVTADYVWGAGETHFGRHRFAVTVHRLDPVTLTYSDVLRYVTATKYPSLDEGGVNVVGPETPEIARILRFVYGKN